MEDENIKKLENELENEQIEQKALPRTEAKATVRKSRKAAVAMVGCVILALVGIGFGAYGLIAGGKAEEQNASLNSELDQKKETIRKIEEQLGVKVETEDETKSEIVTVSAAEKGYIYIGEWGIKIKISAGLASVSYVFHAARGTQTLYVSGVDCSGGACQYVPEFVETATDMGSGLGALSRYSKAEADEMAKTMAEQSGLVISGSLKVGDLYGLASAGTIVFIDDEGYYYVYGHPQAVIGAQNEAEWEVRSANKVGEMLKTGISKF